jgi:hypothetical protein
MKFADPKNKKYPIDDREEIRAAWNYIHMPKNQKGYTRNELYQVMQQIERAWRTAFGEAPPAAKRLAHLNAKPKVPHAAKFVGSMDDDDDDTEVDSADDSRPHMAADFAGDSDDDDVSRNAQLPVHARRRVAERKQIVLPMNPSDDGKAPAHAPNLMGR